MRFMKCPSCGSEKVVKYLSILFMRFKLIKLTADIKIHRDFQFSL